MWCPGSPAQVVTLRSACSKLGFDPLPLGCTLFLHSRRIMVKNDLTCPCCWMGSDVVATVTFQREADLQVAKYP